MIVVVVAPALRLSISHENARTTDEIYPTTCVGAFCLPFCFTQEPHEQPPPFFNNSSPFAIPLVIIKYLSSAGLLESTCRKLTTLRGRPLHLHWKPFSHILSMAISATHQSSSSLLVRVYGIFEKTFLSRSSIHLYTALRTSNRFHDRDLGFLTTHILDVPISSRLPVN
jgi:hypothetical protein